MDANPGKTTSDDARLSTGAVTRPAPLPAPDGELTAGAAREPVSPVEPAPYDAHAVTTEDGLRALYGQAGILSIAKSHDRLNRLDVEFIARSPFLVLGTQSVAGRADVSPRGDPPGFVRVLDDRHVAIPDRPGNNRLDSLANIIANPAVGLLFMVPGFDDTLRINGRARIVTDPDLLSALAVRDRPATLAVIVAIDEIFMHCAKAFRRSKLWDPASLQDRNEMPSLPAIIMETASGTVPPADDVAVADAKLEEAYVQRLY